MTLMQSFSPTSLEQYKTLARSWAATVTVVTVRRTEAAIAAGEAELDGFTATAFFTVSMAPPIIAVSATSASSALGMLRAARGFAVNLLAPDQQDAAGAFARPAVERVDLWKQLPGQATSREPRCSTAPRAPSPPASASSSTPAITPWCSAT